MLEKITKVLREYKGDDSLEVTPQMTFAALELDSLDTVELIMNLEDEFDTTIEMEEALTTIQDLMNLLENNA